jgi:phosphoglycolate phosphatase-like HAD superfamily hydrolase
VVVGDTPADVAGAWVGGVASVVFSSTRYSATALSSAEAVVTQVEQLVATLESWQVLGVPA